MPERIAASFPKPSPRSACVSPMTCGARAVRARTIGIKLRFEDFKTVTRDLTLPEPVADGADIRRAAGECLKRVDLTRSLRLLGVRASSLTRG